MKLSKWLVATTLALASLFATGSAKADTQKRNPEVKLELGFTDEELSLETSLSLYSFLGRVPELAVAKGVTALPETDNPRALRMAYYALASIALYRWQRGISVAAHEMGHANVMGRDARFETGDYKMHPTFVNSLVVGFRDSFTGSGAATQYLGYASLDTGILADAAGINMEEELRLRLARDIQAGKGTVIALGPYLNLALGALMYGDDSDGDIVRYIEDLGKKGIKTSYDCVTNLSLLRLLSGSFLSLVKSIPDFVQTGDTSVVPITFKADQTVFYLPEIVVRYGSRGPTIGIIERVERGPLTIDLGIEAAVERPILESSLGITYSAGGFSASVDASVNQSGGYIVGGSLAYEVASIGPMTFSAGVRGHLAGGTSFEREATSQPPSNLEATLGVKITPN